MSRLSDLTGAHGRIGGGMAGLPPESATDQQQQHVVIITEIVTFV